MPASGSQVDGNAGHCWNKSISGNDWNAAISSSL